MTKITLLGGQNGRNAKMTRPNSEMTKIALFLGGQDSQNEASERQNNAIGWQNGQTDAAERQNDAAERPNDQNNAIGWPK